MCSFIFCVVLFACCCLCARQFNFYFLFTFVLLNFICVNIGEWRCGSLSFYRLIVFVVIIVFCCYSVQKIFHEKVHLFGHFIEGDKKLLLYFLAPPPTSPTNIGWVVLIFNKFICIVGNSSPFLNLKNDHYERCDKVVVRRAKETEHNKMQFYLTSCWLFEVVLCECMIISSGSFIALLNYFKCIAETFKSDELLMKKLLTFPRISGGIWETTEMSEVRTNDPFSASFQFNLRE